MFLKSFKWLYICCCYFISTTSVFGQKQAFSEEFKKEIVSICQRCFQDSVPLQAIKKDQFHLAYHLFSKNEIDSSYAIITKLLSKNSDQEIQKLYILNTLKGRILLRKKLLDEAQLCFQKAIEYGKQYQSPSLHNQYALLGQVYLEKEAFSKAIEVFETWKSSYVTNEFNNRINLHNLGICYLHEEKYEKAQENLLESYRLNQQYKDTLGLARSSLDIANLYYQQYKDDLAIPFFEKGLAYAKRANNLEVLQNALVNLSVVEENRKDVAKALSYRKEFDKIKDSIWNRDKIWETAQNDKKIAQTINEEKLKAEQQEKFLFIIIAILAIAVLLLLSYFYLKMRKQNTVIKELNTTKNKLFSILTHDLKTPVHTLKSKLYHSIQQKEKNGQDQRELTALTESYDLAKNTALLIDNTLHWTLQHQNKLLFQQQKLPLFSIVEQVLYDFLPIIEEHKLTINTTIDEAIFVYADTNSLKIIIRNVLDNAIKFSPSGEKINIKATEEASTCTLQIIDHGCGFDTTLFSQNKTTSTKDTKGQTSTGLGLQLSKELTEKNGGNFTISTATNKGTTVSITLQSKVI